MKNFLIKTTLALFCFFLGLTACGGASANEETPASSNPVFILFYTDN